jgi:hypothetical protein
MRRFMLSVNDSKKDFWWQPFELIFDVMRPIYKLLGGGQFCRAKDPEFLTRGGHARGNDRIGAEWK